MTDNPAKPAKDASKDIPEVKEDKATIGEFNRLLDLFEKATETSMDAALKLSHLAMKHFAVHGDLSYAQKFLDKMHVNYNRKAAFIQWMQAFSPVKTEGTLKSGYVLKKDKSPTAIAFNVEGALRVPYWDYAPPKEEINFDEKDVVSAIKTAINKFRRDRYHATTDRALFALAQADMVCRHLENAISSGKPISVTETANDTVMVSAKAA